MKSAFVALLYSSWTHFVPQVKCINFDAIDRDFTRATFSPVYFARRELFSKAFERIRQSRRQIEHVLQK